jgi:hypothetical protein
MALEPEWQQLVGVEFWLADVLKVERFYQLRSLLIAHFALLFISKKHHQIPQTTG